MYAMKVDEILHFDDYYRDPRFKQKKPVKNGQWPKPLGDNMYHFDDNGHWRQHPTNFHTDLLEKDTTNPYVFIANEFYYFGKNRPVQQLPKPADALEQYWLARKVARGTKYFRDSEYPAECRSFVEWLRNSARAMVSDIPLDRDDYATGGCGNAIDSC